MSQQNVEIVRSYVDLLRDYEWDRLADLLSDDLIYRPVPEITEAGQYIGPHAFRHFAEQFQRGEWLKSFDQRVTSIRDYGDAVILRVQFAGQGRASGADFAGRFFEVLTLRDGKIVLIEDFVERDEALKAAGGE
jgi:ketosteroid isomerase-like protein